MKIHSIGLLFLLLIVFIDVSCNKDKLDLRPDKKLVVPETVEDFQSMLDNDSKMNVNFPALGEIGADNYFVVPNVWNGLTPIDRNSYVWEKDPFGGLTVTDWNSVYSSVFQANVVIKELEKNTKLDKTTDEYKNIKGSALFYRAHAFYQLAQIFCKPYDSVTAANDLGIPLRLTPEVLALIPRATIQETYDQIIADLVETESLLPATTQYRTRPSKAAVNALLARTFLSMQKYNQALGYADKCLLQYNTLLDYNTLSVSSSTPFAKYNAETIFFATMATHPIFNQTNSPVDTTLYRSYQTNDLRRQLFYTTGNPTLFKGSYGQSTSSNRFCGIATDEVFLIRAECNARLGKISEAMKDLNDLLRTRWKKVNGVSTYVDQTATTSADALNKILVERRKELVFRGLRWVDLRRFNKEGAKIEITRNLSGQIYTLASNSPLYVYPIPAAEISINPVPQNDR